MANTLNESVCDIDQADYRFVLEVGKKASTRDFIARIFAAMRGSMQMSVYLDLVLIGFLAAGTVSWLNSSFLISGLVLVRVNGLSTPNTLNESVWPAFKSGQ
jgi:hypothetical protein